MAVLVSTLDAGSRGDANFRDSHRHRRLSDLVACLKQSSSEHETSLRARQDRILDNTKQINFERIDVILPTSIT